VKEEESKSVQSWAWWLKPVILVTQEAKIRRIMVQSQPGQKENVYEISISTNSWAQW
jgi:hypothetical protein